MMKLVIDCNCQSSRPGYLAPSLGVGPGRVPGLRGVKAEGLPASGESLLRRGSSYLQAIRFQGNKRLERKDDASQGSPLRMPADRGKQRRARAAARKAHMNTPVERHGASQSRRLLRRPARKYTDNHQHTT